MSLHRREQEANKIQTRCRHPGYPRDPRPDWPHPQGVPGQDRPRGSASPGFLVARSHETHLMCPSDPQRAHHRQMQRHHLTTPVTSRLVTFSACSGLLVQRSWLHSGFDPCFPRVRTVFFLASPDSMCKKLGHCASCCVGGAGFVLEVSYGTDRLRPSGGP